MSVQSNDKSISEQIVEMMVRVFMIAFFLLMVTPRVIAPIFGVTPESFRIDDPYWLIVSIALGYIASWPVSKILLRNIKTRGV